MPEHNHIDLIELPAADASALGVAKGFYSAAFGWSFTDYGDAYSDTASGGLTVGLNASGGDVQQRMPLAVLYVDNLEAARDRVVAAGGTLVHDIYSFPGGRRFHFADPAGNELAAWSE